MHRSIQLEISVPADPQKVWTSWTTDEGIKSFFAPECCIDLKPGGKYEMYFDPDAETGSRGGEGCRILALDEPHFLSFTWNAPPSIPSLRNANQHTHVTIRIYS